MKFHRDRLTWIAYAAFAELMEDFAILQAKAGRIDLVQSELSAP